MSMSVCTHTCRGYSAVTAVELQAEPVERGPVKLHTQADPSILTPCLLSVRQPWGCLGVWLTYIGPHLEGI